ncbi:deoxyuridine 5'-triphosphate nucleotidohydrolase, mitochondrial isoform X1 [Mustela erminea]|uniref:deoxyuridine 5'-triphosphate nucleotidohydrolase, mitochondrial isoform X1 n=1 Tax=Mustela erminea TaxID=36723 RepID=UPI0013866E4A|nr:deoxyuridine 5'-triphosphate nucleotidohydrolase, mitochondrial isoform X1 [Mustela erminea]XP_032199532.1 deoxyuridine 5'-triphosphate nucleotidohydrolase, mitochondrial isoform X1 [Mustela erminea]
MTLLGPHPALRQHFFTSVLRWRAGPRAEAAGPPFRPLSSTRSRSRGCRGATTPATSPSKRPRPAEDSMRLRFVRLSEHATAPTKGSARAAGYDLYSAYDYTLPPMEKALVKTDIQVALPSGCYGRVAPRSGLAAKHFIDVGAGVIDEDYRGNVGVVLFNFGKEKFEVKKGDRIAQLICERIFYPEIEEVQPKMIPVPISRGLPTLSLEYVSQSPWNHCRVPLEWKLCQTPGVTGLPAIGSVAPLGTPMASWICPS